MVTVSEIDRPLFEALRRGDLAALRQALARGANPDAQTGEPPPHFADDIPALVLAAWTGQLGLVECLLEAGADVSRSSTTWQTYAFNDDATAFDGPTPISAAAREGHLPVVLALLARGASLDHGSPAPLISAAEFGHVHVARALLERGADPNVSDGDRHTPLFFAARAGSVELVRLLVAAGGRFDRAGDLAEARRLAGAAGHSEIVALLVDARVP